MFQIFVRGNIMQYQIKLLKQLIGEFKAHSSLGDACYSNSVQIIEQQLNNLEQNLSNTNNNQPNDSKIILQIKNQIAEYLPTDELKKIFSEKFRNLGKVDKKNIERVDVEIKDMVEKLSAYIKEYHKKIRHEVFETRKTHIQDSDYNKRLFENNGRIKLYQGELGIFAQHLISWLHQFFNGAFIIGFDRNDQATLIAKMQDVRSEIRSALNESEMVQQYNESIINNIIQSYLWHTVARWQAQSTNKILDAKYKYNSQQTFQLEDIKEKNEFLNDIQLNLVLNEPKPNYVGELQAKFIMAAVFLFLNSEEESKEGQLTRRQQKMHEILLEWDNLPNKRKEPMLAIQKLKKDGCVYLDFIGLIYKALCKAIQLSIFNIKHEFTGIVNKLSSPALLRNKIGEIIMENKITEVEAEVLDKIQNALKLVEINKNSYMKVLKEIVIILKDRILQLEEGGKGDKPTAHYYMKLLKMITASQENINSFERMIEALNKNTNNNNMPINSSSVIVGVTHFQPQLETDSSKDPEILQSNSTTLEKA